MLKKLMARNGKKGNNGAANSKTGTFQLEGGGNPEVAFIFKISPNSVEEIFKVQLFSRNNNFLGLIRNQLYNGSYIQKEDDNEVKLDCVVNNNNTPLGISREWSRGIRLWVLALSS
ncbi:uncharacterized protein LOC110725486 [Chenopodium quinoa]|uniref:uncharacterized protein LOC110725486 n=1 Tax=Chenopodium quinoa TaxID=63459 RepID=UPI000B798AD7|nr:uncharacterized protein LOC110725486 [Chenopodium quinoa]